MNPPAFTYHPDPLSTGSVEASAEVCQVCGLIRGYVYTGPIYGEVDFDGPLCPWCIADSSAHDKLDLEFTDPAGIGGYGRWDSVPRSVIEELVYHTPGFSSWQQEQWFTHCGDAAMFLGPVGYTELQRFGADAVNAMADAGYGDIERDEFVQSLRKDGSLTGYLFRCRHCGTFGGYADMD